LRKSDIPFGSEFSPSQIELPRVLELANDHGGDWKAFEAAVRSTYFDDHSTSEDNRKKLANNTRLGMIAYGIIDRDANLTECGKKLYDARETDEVLYRLLARHILLHLRGLTLVRCIQDMTAAGEEVKLTTLRDGLAVRGVHYPPGGKHPSMMRLWLAKAGVIAKNRWQVDQAKLKEVLGSDPDDYDLLAGLTTEQKAFLRALCNTGTTTPQPANEIARLASMTYGVKFPEKSLPKLVLHALVEAGFIRAVKTTEGRGAKPFLVSPTEKLIAEVVEPLLEQLANQSDPKLLALLRRPLSAVLEELDSEDRHIAGLALEALGFKLMRLLDMDHVATRLRGSATGGAEVDLIFHSTRLVYSRWQVQCKNTARVSLDDIAKEVGLTHLLKSTVIVIVTTGEVGAEARKYAAKIMSDSNLAIVMVNGADLAAINRSPSHVVAVFHREADKAMKLKPQMI
jgi:site-specific DNA-methyltransferase (cytosine-N4-specific)